MMYTEWDAVEASFFCPVDDNFPQVSASAGSAGSGSTGSSDHPPESSIIGLYLSNHFIL